MRTCFRLLFAIINDVAYVELHARSAFSFLEGASVPEDLASQCSQLQQKAVAITDLQGVYGAPRLYLAAKQLGIKALLGAEINNDESCRYTLLVESRTGYQNLCRLITRMNFRDGKPGKPENPFAIAEDFVEYAEGLVCLTGGEEGPLAQVYSNFTGPAAASEAKNRVERLVQTFGPRNVFIELQRHGDREQEFRNQAAIEISEEQ